MGFFGKLKDKVKDTTGLGLNATEQYNRAYEKGVLLTNYDTAAKNFEAASEKFSKDGNTQMAQRASANARLYSLLATRDCATISSVAQALEQLPEIETIGRQNEMTPTKPVVTELRALHLQFQGDNAADSVQKAALYKQAGETMMQLGYGSPQLAEKLGLNGPMDKCATRALYCMGLSDYHNALAVVLESPELAHDALQRASSLFRQAKDDSYQKQMDGYIDAVQAKRHCWMCGREMQGRDFFFKYYPTTVEKYHHHLIESRKEDTGMLDTAGSVTLCTICGEAIEAQADRYALQRMKELREWVAPILENHNDRLKAHDERLTRLESLAHKHS